MLLIDGVKYEPWTPSGPHGEDEFEQVVGEHAEEIFGKDAKYFDLKHKLASKSGTGSIPDGYVITLGNKPGVQIIEFELESHSLQHIVPQMVNIINGIANSTTQQKICNAIEDGIKDDEIFLTKITKAIKAVSIHRFLSDCFSNTLPTINIIIDESWSALEEAISKITPTPKIIEFRTYTREKVGLEAHAHLFESLNKSVTVIPKPLIEMPSEDSFEVTLQPSYIDSYCIYIPAARKHLFPTSETVLELDSDKGLIQVKFNIDSFGIWLSTGLSKWFKEHKELKKGDKLRIGVLEPMKKYRLEIVS